MESGKTGKMKIEIINEMLNQKLNKLSSNNAAASIYKVTQKLRNANEAAYTPQLVSIGPLHRGLPGLQAMEACKLRFLNNFLVKFGIHLKPLIEFSEKKEDFVRGYYEGTFRLSSTEFIEMILLDGVFIVELFLECHFFHIRDRQEMVFKNNWMYKDLLHDMLLVENQLPISIMEGILSHVDSSFYNNRIKPTIYHLAHKFFKDVGSTKNMPLTARCHGANHFVEFLLILHAPQSPLEPKRLQTSTTTKIEKYTTRSATELRQAGVTFQCGKDSCLFKIVFEKGVLTVPQLTVNHSTETFFRNLIAFEQCGYSSDYSEDITSYVILMDTFIDTRHDVDLLVDKKIIKNELGDSQKVADLFNNLYKEVVTEANIFYFDQLYQELNEYSRDRLHQWKAKCFIWSVELKRDYFRSPWSFMSVLAVAVGLILTLVQTVCSVLQV